MANTVYYLKQHKSRKQRACRMIELTSNNEILPAPDMAKKTALSISIYREGCSTAYNKILDKVLKDLIIITQLKFLKKKKSPPLKLLKNNSQSNIMQSESIPIKDYSL